MQSRHDGINAPNDLVHIAHAARDANGDWRDPHDLIEHSYSVGELAAEFAQRFGADWARIAGRWHDLGKFRPLGVHAVLCARGCGLSGDRMLHGESPPPLCVIRFLV